MLLKAGPNSTLKLLKISKKLRKFILFHKFIVFSFDIPQDILNTKSASWLKKVERHWFTVLKDLLTDVIIGQDFMDKHQNVNIHLGGPLPTLHLGGLEAVKMSTPIRLFQHLKSECRPIASKSRQYSHSDSVFISYKVKQLSYISAYKATVR